MRRLRRSDVERLDPGVRRIMNPHIYHVSLTQGLWDLKQALTHEAMVRTEHIKADFKTHNHSGG
jgi:nicotinate phosphoribosyltransferase